MITIMELSFVSFYFYFYFYSFTGCGYRLIALVDEYCFFSFSIITLVVSGERVRNAT